MRWTGILLTLFGIFWAMPQLVYTQTLQHVPGEILVSLAPGTSTEVLQHGLEAFGMEGTFFEKRISNLLNVWLLHTDPPTEEPVMKWLERQPEVQMVQLNGLVEVRSVIPNDPFFTKQWHHLNDGSGGGLANADFDSDAAWNMATGGVTPAGDTIVVAVIDGGLDATHPDLVANLWRNRAEIPNDGLDNDENGYVDDVRGWNVLKLNDDISGLLTAHGTPVSGIIGARGNNGIGVTGINWAVKIMFVAGGGTQAGVLAAYDYVWQARRHYNATQGKQGAFVVTVNNSFGTNYGLPANAPLWCAAFDSLGAAGILSVAATANLPIDVDVLGDLPTTCPSDYLLSVTSLTRSDLKAASAAWGKKNVDLGAYGDGVFTTATAGGYDSFGGTSFAAPQVSGAVALLYAAPCPALVALAKVNPAAAALLVKKRIIEGTLPNAAIQGITSSGGRLNLYKLLQSYENGCPDCPPPFALETSQPTTASIVLSWNQSVDSEQIKLRWREKGAVAWKLESNVQSPFLLKNLTVCTAYEFGLQSACSNNEFSDWSSTSAFSTEGCCVPPTKIQPSLPAQPTSVELTWTPVFAAQAYRLRLRPQNGVWAFYEFNINSAKLVNLSPCTPYEVAVQTFCGSSNPTAFSASIFFKTAGCSACTDANYCTSGAEESIDEWIAGVQIGSWSHFSGNLGGYQNFTAEPPGIPEFHMKSSIPVTIIPGFSGQAFKEFFRVFVDFNADGDFDDAGELAFDPGFAHNGPMTGTLYTPEFTTSGLTRMRVVMKFGTASIGLPKACEIFGFGQVEDYCARLVPGISATTAAEPLGQLRVFPQPATQFVALTVSGEKLDGKWELAAWNTAGQGVEVIASDSSSEGVEIDVSRWSPGMYLVRAESEGQVFWGRILKI